MVLCQDVETKSTSQKRSANVFKVEMGGIEPPCKRLFLMLLQSLVYLVSFEDEFKIIDYK